MITYDFEQGSPEWLQARAGKISASRFGDLMALLKSGKPGASRQNLEYDLAVERMTGQKLEGFTNAAMQRGIDLEPLAREAYENAHFVAVDEVGMVRHATLEHVTCSPDGMVGDDGLVEIKCMGAMNHIKQILDGYATQTYRWQLQGQLWICEREWVDLACYHPEMPEHLRLHVVRVERDAEAIKELEAECIKADAAINEIITRLEKAA